MNEFLRKFDTIIFVAPLSIFRNFLRIFHFLNLNLDWLGTGRNWNGTDRFPVPTGFLTLGARRRERGERKTAAILQEKRRKLGFKRGHRKYIYIKVDCGVLSCVIVQCPLVLYLDQHVGPVWFVRIV